MVNATKILSTIFLGESFSANKSAFDIHRDRPKQSSNTAENSKARDRGPNPSGKETRFGSPENMAKLLAMRGN